VDGAWKIQREHVSCGVVTEDRPTATEPEECSMRDLTVEEIVAEVETTMRGLYETLAAADFDAWMNTLHDPAGRWLVGMDVADIRETSQDFLDAWKPDGETPIDRQEIDDLQISVEAINATTAYAVCTCPDRRWHYISGKVDRASTAETWVFVLTEDGWKLHSGQSAIFPIEE
jgi:hypothetical protein